MGRAGGGVGVGGFGAGGPDAARGLVGLVVVVWEEGGRLLTFVGGWTFLRL